MVSVNDFVRSLQDVGMFSAVLDLSLRVGDRFVCTIGISNDYGKKTIVLDTGADSQFREVSHVS